MADLGTFLNPATLGASGSTFALVIVYFLEFAVVATLLFAFVYYYLLFPQKILIIERIGDKGWELKTTRGRLKNHKDNVQKLELFRKKTKVNPVANWIYGLYKKKRCLILTQVGTQNQPAIIDFP